MRTLKLVSLAAPLAMALVAAPVWAHGGGDRGACRADVQRLCPDITPGPGSWKSIHACLTQNAANAAKLPR